MFNTYTPVLRWEDCDTFQLAQVMRVLRPRGDLIEIPILHVAGHRYLFRTDGGSKPLWTNLLAGDRVDEFLPAYIAHDWLCAVQEVKRDGALIYVDFDYALEALHEMCAHLCDTRGAPRAKAARIIAGVRIGGEKFWHPPRRSCDVTGPCEDWAVATVRVIPDFDVEDPAGTVRA